MPTDNCIRVSHSFVQLNAAPPTQVFPLLCPVREAEWVPDWQYRLVFSASGLAELDCVFVTPEENGGKTIWQCTRYDPERFAIEYVWVRPQMLTAHLRLRAEARPDGRSDTHISYTYTALSERGVAELRRMDRAWFEHKMQSWQSAINYYLKTGKRISAGAWE